MTEPLLSAQSLAQSAGLDKAWSDHRAEVEAAIAAAARLRAAFARPATPDAEPLPAYRAPHPGAHTPAGRAAAA
jgi:hypothetical protein